MFLDSSWSDEEEADDVGKSRRVSKKLSKKNKSGLQSGKAENRGSDCLLAKQDSTPENSWTCPLTLDEISPSASDTEMEESSSHSAGPASFQLASKKCSGMILKLRRMFVEGVKRKKARYQAVSFSGTITEPAPSQTQDEEGGVSKERSSDKVLHRVTAKLTSRWQRTGSLSHVLRPLRSSTKRTQRSLLKIKYCPYLSACHSAEYRRRWVLRSAVQRARRAMRFHYPDLVGKRIRHLYEEDDKSEVWYRGEVMRVHEAHANPLKTIFEVRYDSEPEWKYYLELLIDYKKGWLKIED